MRLKTCLLAATCIAATSTPAFAAPGDPIVLGDDLVMDILANARLRYETVDQDNALEDADAVTLRGRLGVEFATNGFKLLAEGEGTVALGDNYNDTIPGNGAEPYSVVADPESLELNRLQLSYTDTGFTGTFGRQRINMGNQRFIGAVGWRQNEQTFDALRVQVGTGPFSADAAWAISQHTIFGHDSPNRTFDGDFYLLNLRGDFDVIDVTAYSYTINYDTRVAFSSQTFGLTASTELPLGTTKLNLSASYATQSDAGGNLADYNADYFDVSASTSYAGFTLALNYEELGSDGGVAAFQTPMATLHAFQGWADIFLTTPNAGVRDYNATLRKQFSVPGIGNVTGAVTYHDFDSDFGGVDYGSEWDASLGFKLGPVNLLAKYANYDANALSVNTEKFWIQAEYGF